jgi:hypothetical protein
MATFTPIKNQKQTKGALLGTMLYAINKKKPPMKGKAWYPDLTAAHTPLISK